MIGAWHSFLSTSSLGFRLVSTVILALLPLGILSVFQTESALDRVDATTLEGIGGASLQAVRGQIDLIKEAEISARVLASVLGGAETAGTSCVDRVTSLAGNIPEAVLVAYIPNSGLMTCSSTGRVFDFAGDPRFDILISEPAAKMVYNPHGPVSGTAVVGVSHPVFDQSGTMIGVAVISLPYTAVAPDIYADAVAQWQPSYLGTFLADGTLLLPSGAEPSLAATIPKMVDSTRLASYVGRPVFLPGKNGRQILSVVAVTQDLFLVSVWQPVSGGFRGWASSISPYLLPALTWIAALGAAAFAVNRLVVRHVRALSHSMSDYISTRTRVKIPDMGDAPIEIQRLHAAYEGLIRTIEQEEADLQNLLVDKDMLIHEVNHRSGNSLQIIASIMRLYRREASDPELQAVLDGLINRVIALSSTHTSLYALSGQRDVAVDVVLTNVILRLKEIHGVALGVAVKRFQPIRVDAQVAMPLALALAEAVGCFFSVRQLASEEITVSLSEEAGVIRLGVEGPVVPELRPESTSGLEALPQRMLRQFAVQLSGQFAIRIEGDRAIVELTFPRPVPKPSA
ncbi:MAG: hypothetical protein HC844_08565 [Tabrizicola sp.]|nr:hypothetical protein [Tabrizicola sp.]